MSVSIRGGARVAYFECRCWGVATSLPGGAGQLIWPKKVITFSRRFYPKRLTFRYSLHFQYECSLGIEPTTFCTANTMLYHWATGTYYYYFSYEHTHTQSIFVTFYYMVIWLIAFFWPFTLTLILMNMRCAGAYVNCLWVWEYYRGMEAFFVFSFT